MREMSTILITPRGYAKYGREAAKQLEGLGYELDMNCTGKPLPRDIFIEKAKKAAGIIVGVDQLDRALLQECQNLRGIVKFGVGTDNIDLEACKELGILVERCLGTNSNAVAELTVGLMFACARGLVGNAAGVKCGGWDKPTGYELKGKKLGIAGFGAIGKNVARMARGIGMKLMVYDIFELSKEVLKEYDAVQADLAQILEECDVITLHVPLTDDTRHMISEKEFEQMKSNAILINAARGGIVDERALYEALRQRKLYAAASDVFTAEPPSGESWVQELLAMEQFILTAHIGSRSREAEINTVNLATKHMIRLLS